MGLVIKIPDSLVGLLIGRGGQGLRHLEAENAVKITVGKLVEGGQRRVCIEGNAPCQAKAADMINHFVAMKEAQDAAKQVMTKQVMCSEILPIPERFVGLMIGRGGENINRVRDTFGVDCKFDKEALTPSETRILTLRGCARKVERATEQVEMMLLQFHRKDGLFNRELEEKYARHTLPPVVPHPQGMQGAGPRGGREATLREASMRECVPMQAAGPDGTWPLAAAAGAQPPPPPPQGMDPALVQHPMPQCCPGQPQDFTQGAMDNAVWAARYAEVLPWATYYANDETCVNYYMQLRAAAAEAASCIATQIPHIGGA